MSEIILQPESEIILKPDSIVIKPISAHHVSVIIEPLERGFGHTLGNALRRVLLSSLSGFGVVEISIDGVSHPYATIDGVQEDVLDIMLNVKGAAFILEGTQNEVVINLSKKGEGPVTLSDIVDLDRRNDIKVVNPNHVIATLNKPGRFNMTLKVARGRGEQFSETRIENEEESRTGKLYLDTVFNPVRRVNYTVEHARVGQRTDFDKLVIELETNGAIDPKEAIYQAVSILQDQLAVLSTFFKTKPDAKKAEAGPIDPALLPLIDELGLSQRLCNSLRSSNLHFIGDLVTKTKDELLHMPNLGVKSINEIEKVLKSHGLLLGMEIPNWPPEELEYPV